MQRGSRTTQGCRTQYEHRASQQHATPAIQQGSPSKRKGGTPTIDGRVTVTAPALQSPCHPTTAMPPRHPRWPPLHHCEGGVDRGYPVTRTAQTHTPHAHHITRQRHSTRHDRSASEYCAGMGRTWAGVHALGRPATAHHHRHSTHHTRRGWTPSTHLLSHCSRSHNQRTIMINVDQQSMIDQRTTNDEHDDDQ